MDGRVSYDCCCKLNGDNEKTPRDDVERIKDHMGWEF